MKKILFYFLLFTACDNSVNSIRGNSIILMSQECQNSGIKVAIAPTIAILTKDSSTEAVLLSLSSNFYCTSNAKFNGSVNDTLLTINWALPSGETVSRCVCNSLFIFKINEPVTVSKKIREIKFNDINYSVEVQ